MSEKEIFEYLFELSQTSKDKEGSVAACLVRNGEVLFCAASSDDSMFHAEELIFQQAKEEWIDIEPSDVLYAIIEPCNKRNSGKTDCCSLIIISGIRNVVFAVPNSTLTKETQKMLKEAGVNIRQTENKETIEKAKKLFNDTMLDPEGYKL
ncbi:MAG: deaminase [Candidatus Pacebacteria bacterium]|nr:deaminase [Candidatus Paceibacterota bacterium]